MAYPLLKNISQFPAKYNSFTRALALALILTIIDRFLSPHLLSTIKNYILQHVLLQLHIIPFQHGFLVKQSTLSALIASHNNDLFTIVSNNTHYFFYPSKALIQFPTAN